MPESIPRDFAGFVRRFATEAACRSYLASLRWPEGFVCLACGRRKGWPTARGTVFCASCRRQTSPTAGTVLHGSRVPLRKWFLAMRRACTGKTGLSPKALQRELELGSYRTAWLMVRRLRQAMGGVARERLRGKVEVDEILVGRREARSVSGSPAESARTAQGLLGVSSSK
ncbi:MAG: IS1595 family transposase, partial [Planctomycetota bacterium]